MTENVITQSYCEVCGIDVDPQTNLRRFGKPFCSDEHLDQYVKSRQRRMGYIVTDDNYDQAEQEEEERHKNKRSWFRGGCC
jgi:anaerobic ribonucleoside-triphosphate reductase